MYKVSVVGLGKLGSCLLATIADAGYTVVGVDKNAEVVEAINSGRSMSHEEGLDELLQKNFKRIIATQDFALTSDSAIVFILVNTPSLDDGSFSVGYVRQVAEMLGRQLKNSPRYQLIVVESTVMPGDTEGKIIPLLEHYSGKTCGKHFGVCYIPEFVALGSILCDMIEPQYIVIGENDKAAGDLAESFFKSYTMGYSPILRMSIPEAEIVKIALNAYITTKISFANTLAEVCENTANANVDTVTKALSRDRRISSSYFKGGLNFSGPCFPRDTKSYACLLRRLHIRPLQIVATDIQNSSIIKRIVAKVCAGTIAILGVAFKPGTDYIECSPGIDMINWALENGRDVIVYDPLTQEILPRIYGDSIRYADSAEECVADADNVIVATSEVEFTTLEAEDFKLGAGIIDCWRILHPTIACWKLGVGYEECRYLYNN